MPIYYDNNPRVPYPSQDGQVLTSQGGNIIWANASTVFTQVDTFDDLPPAAEHNLEIYYVVSSTGVWLLNRKSRGFYRSNGIDWEYGGELLESHSSSAFRIYDYNDTSKQIAFDLSNLSASNIRDIVAANHAVNLSELRQGVLAADMPCDSSVLIGDVVAIDSSGTLIKALGDSISNANVIGICEYKKTAELATVRLKGFSQPYLTGLTPGTKYFLSASSSGGLTTAFPITQNSVVYYIGVAVNAYSLYVEPQLLVIRS